MPFSKLHGAGNDYVLVNGLREEYDWPALSTKVSDRHFGVGSDGLIVVTPSEKADVRMRMFNPDGSESEMCGNGIRCFTKFVLERDLARAGEAGLKVETGAGILTIVPCYENGVITRAKVDMGAPILRAPYVPADQSKAGPSDHARLNKSLVRGLGISPDELIFDAPITVDGTRFVVTAVSMGNPHAVAFLDTPVKDVDLERLGPPMEHHPAFPRRVNFHVANLVDKRRMVTRTWERGAGQTLACGTGACAMVVAARLHGMVESDVTVEVPGGELQITWPGGGPIYMEGPVVEVFTGEVAAP
ncbi:MAG: diaminopimelate epimerase [SAR202 cluster bacterium]|nr:diaminopimelate epimerase [SAR202 cluster bacterium]